MTSKHDLLRRMLSPRGLAVVGASGRSQWSRMLHNNLEAYAYPGAVHLVNPRGGEAFGRRLFASCDEIEGPLDVALLLVPNSAVPSAMRDAACAGAAGVVVLAGGYREAGAEGRAAERELVELGEELDLLVLGPNGLGFANLLQRAPGWMGPVPTPVLAGPVGIISQSGNIAGVLGSLAARRGVGVSHIISTGNEAMVDLADVADVLVDDPAVRVLAIFAESISQPERFVAVAQRAADLEKPIVILKIGRSELAQRLAATHTGALAGDDAVLDAVFRSYGIVRVDSLEQLVTTAGLLASTGPLPPGGLGIVSVSGGVNDIIADRAEAFGVALPRLGPATEARLSSLELPLAVSQNPLDVTGAGGRVEAAWVESIRAMLDDPGISLVAAAGLERLAHPGSISTEGVDEERVGWIASAFATEEARGRGLIILSASQTISEDQAATLQKLDAPFVAPGIEDGLAAIGRAMQWSAWLKNGGPSDGRVEPLQIRGDGTWSEWRALELLAQRGVPVVPARLARTRDEAIAFAVELGSPVALKVASPLIPHKTDVGGVQLDLRDPHEVATAYDQIMESVRSLDPDPEGVLVSPMRPTGLDLIAGTVRDPDWGTLLVVGAGGVLAEAIPDTAVALLPVSADTVQGMLRSLRCAPLFEGVRGSEPIDVQRLAMVINRLASTAEALGDHLQSIEINPLRVRGDHVEALDALIQWR